MDTPELVAIWNRALESINPNARIGDRALSSMLGLHGLIMNGGVLNAVEITDESRLEEAISSYESFGLRDARALFKEAKGLNAAGGRLDEQERRLDVEYSQLVPNDSHLFDAFAARVAVTPGDFLPL